MRIFIGIPCSHDTKLYLHDIQSRLLIETDKANPTAIDNFHLTLLFIGEVNEDDIKSIIQKIKPIIFNTSPFEITYDHLGTFSQSSGDICWIGVHQGSKNLKQLYIALKNELQDLLHLKFQEQLVPHVTLARKVSFTSDFDLSKIKVHQHVTRVEQVIIYHSHQINSKLTYTPLKTIHMKGHVNQ